MLRWIYGTTSGAALILYAYLAFTGWEMGTEPRETGAHDIRGSHGHRVFFWHTGPHPGK
jgi:hypothetical protein